MDTERTEEMSPTAQQIMAMLARRRAIERGQEHAMGGGSYHWLIEAVELLLQIELERQEGPK
jgi:hypothetical protein